MANKRAVVAKRRQLEELLRRVAAYQARLRGQTKRPRRAA